MARFSFHNHTYYSNIRLLDALSSPEELIDRAVEIGLAGIGITEHESLSSSVRINQHAMKIAETHPNFKVAIGNEIYLTDTRESNQKYFHFILLAKNATGHKMLRELSSKTWLNAYYDRGMQRVPTLKTELEEIVEKYGKGNLIGSTACIGGELSQTILKMLEADDIGDKQTSRETRVHVIEFINWCKSIFGDDFYLEVAPALYEEQVKVNRKIGEIGKACGVKLTVQDDSHRLSQDDYEAHKAFLNSKMGEREDIDNFYKYTYLQTEDEVREHLADTGLDVDELFANSMEVYDKIESYSLLKNQQVPQVEVPFYPVIPGDTGYKFLDKLYQSENPQERYWVNYCVDELKRKNLYNDTYLSELNEEADVQITIGEKLGTCVFSYPIFLQHYFNLIWECGGCVGVGRGSSGAGLDNYLMNLTQYDPIAYNVNNYFRYLNKERTELPDLDFDLPPTVRPKWFEKIREERGQLGLVQVCTFSTMSSRASVLAACRGYRTVDYPEGIDNDTAQYLTSLIGSERGITYSIDEMIHGNAEKGLKPQKTFVNEISKYPGLLDIILKIEGVISARSIHASGVVFTEPGHEFDNGAFMLAPDGSLITQYSLHDAEAMGNTKIDALVTDVMEKITQCLLLLQKYGRVEKNLTLKELYDKYLHPDVLPLSDKTIWDAIGNNEVVSTFQFDTAVGSQGVKLLKPQNVVELSAINALIRLMAQEKGGETPLNRYKRIKDYPEQWDAEMDDYGLTENEKDIIKEYCGKYYGTLPLQDDLMLMMMDERLFGFDLATTNEGRKIIGKKLIDKIPAFHEKVLKQAKSPALGKYIWDVLFSQEMGYAFNSEHTMSYSMIAVQCVYLAKYFPSVYWNASCLRVAAGLEADTSTNYAKTAKALGTFKEEQGINISLVDINKSGEYFEPDEESNSILYGMKGLNGVGGEIIQEIIANRPYTGLLDFLDKVHCNKSVVVSLIKGGAFDQFDERKNIMNLYIWSVCDTKKRITMQNFAGLKDRNLLPPELNFQKRVFGFNKTLKSHFKMPGKYYSLEHHKIYDFYHEYFDEDLLEVRDNKVCIAESVWKKQYDAAMAPAKKYLSEHKEVLLQDLNNSIFDETQKKYAKGGYSHWEMESLGFYYHEHELIDVNFGLYNVKEYRDLSTNPRVAKTFKRNGREIPIFETYRIAGTVIAKEDAKSSISILTPESGVVTVKFNRDYYAKYNRRVSQVQSDGTKKILENGWFSKGVLVIVNGFRRGDTFVAKSYKNTNSHQLYKITTINEDGTLEMTNERAGSDEE